MSGNDVEMAHTTTASPPPPDPELVPYPCLPDAHSCGSTPTDSSLPTSNTLHPLAKRSSTLHPDTTSSTVYIQQEGNTGTDRGDGIASKRALPASWTTPTASLLLGPSSNSTKIINETRECGPEMDFSSPTVVSVGLKRSELQNASGVVTSNLAGAQCAEVSPPATVLEDGSDAFTPRTPPLNATLEVPPPNLTQKATQRRTTLSSSLTVEQSQSSAVVTSLSAQRDVCIALQKPDVFTPGRPALNTTVEAPPPNLTEKAMQRQTTLSSSLTVEQPQSVLTSLTSRSAQRGLSLALQKPEVFTPGRPSVEAPPNLTEVAPQRQTTQSSTLRSPLSTAQKAASFLSPPSSRPTPQRNASALRYGSLPTAFSTALSADNPEQFRAERASGPTLFREYIVRGCSASGQGLLSEACAEGAVRMVEYLSGVYPGALCVSDCEGQTPLHVAAAAGVVGMFHIFFPQEVPNVRAGRVVRCARRACTMQDVSGRTPLHTAIFEANFASAQILAMHASVQSFTLPDSDGRTVLALLQSGDKEARKLFETIIIRLYVAVHGAPLPGAECIWKRIKKRKKTDGIHIDSIHVHSSVSSSSSGTASTASLSTIQTTGLSEAVYDSDSTSADGASDAEESDDVADPSLLQALLFQKDCCGQYAVPPAMWKQVVATTEERQVALFVLSAFLAEGAGYTVDVGSDDVDEMLEQHGSEWIDVIDLLVLCGSVAYPGKAVLAVVSGLLMCFDIASDYAVVASLLWNAQFLWGALSAVVAVVSQIVSFVCLLHLQRNVKYRHAFEFMPSSYLRLLPFVYEWKLCKSAGLNLWNVTSLTKTKSLEGVVTALAFIEALTESAPQCVLQTLIFYSDENAGEPIVLYVSIALAAASVAKAVGTYVVFKCRNKASLLGVLPAGQTLGFAAAVLADSDVDNTLRDGEEGASSGGITE